MRWLPLLACAWSSGVLLEGAGVAPLQVWVLATAVCGAAASGAAARPIAASRARPSWAAVAPAALIAAATIATGGLASALVRARPVAPAVTAAAGARQVHEGVVRRPVEEGPEVRRVLVDVEGTLAGDHLRSAPARVLVTEPKPGAGAPALSRLLPGDRVRFAARLRAPRGYGNPGAFDRERHLRGRGIDAVATAGAPGLVRLEAPARRSAWRLAARLRDRAGLAIARLPEQGDGRALVDALVLGRRGGLRPALEEAFRRAGVTHVLSVSGLHLAAVALLLFALVRRAWLASPGLAVRVPAERVAAAAAIPAALAYTLVTGGEVATVRAALCALLVLGGAALGRRAHAPSALAVAALVILVEAPLALYEPSFQLSFAASAALAAVGARRLDPPAGIARSGRVARWARALVLASLAASVATAPLTALHFGVIQPAGVVTNLLVVPVAEMVVLPLGLAGALAGALVPAAGLPLLHLAALAARGLAWLVESLAPWAPVISVSPPRPVELAVLGAALVGLATLRPRAAAAGCAVAVLALAALWLHPDDRRGLRVTFLDVGHGDATVIEPPGGETWLVDAGGLLFGGGSAGRAAAADPGEQAVWRFLRARRVRRLDLVVVTHPHPDHLGGLAALAERIPIGEVWILLEEADEASFAPIAARLERRGVPVRPPPAGLARERGGARLVVLAPTEGPGVVAAPPGLGANDRSVVVALEYAGRRLLLLGDVEAEGEAALLAAAPGGALAADVVKVPHHGSPTSSGPALVRATSPALAVVSCDGGDRFGLPAPAVLARWRAAGARIARTDVDGAVTVTVSPTGELAARGHRTRAIPLGAVPAAGGGRGRVAREPRARYEADGRVR